MQNSNKAHDIGVPPGYAAELNQDIHGGHLIPGYVAVLAWNLVAGCPALIDNAGKDALDVGDLVQGLGQRGWLEPSILLLLSPPL